MSNDNTVYELQKKVQYPLVVCMEAGFRLSYDDLAEIMDVLYAKFMFGGNDRGKGVKDTKDKAAQQKDTQIAEMRRRAWSAAWNNILTLAGWSPQEFENICFERVKFENEKSV